VTALLAASALGFVRTGAAHRLARVVRQNVLELYLEPFVHGPAATLPSADAVTTRLATDMPLLVNWAVDGAALVLAAAVAIPAVTFVLVGALGFRVLAPIGVAGLVGGAITMAASRTVTATWTTAWARARALFTAIAAGYEGAIDLRAHDRAAPYADGLRDRVNEWCDAEGRARVASTISTWGAFGATLIAAAGVVELSGGSLAPQADPYRTSLLVLAAVPTLHTLINGIGNLLAARGALRALDPLVAAPLPRAPEHDGAVDAEAEIRLEAIGYAYPPREGDSAAVTALDGLDLTLPAGGSIAITGPNGAGKTTLAHVLVGVVQPDRGRILVSSREARLDDHRFRARVAYLSQRPFEVRDGTLADNLRAFDATIPDARLIDALATVGLLPPLRARAASDAAILALP
jgi:ABC-type transport system involved in cytochrome bd biosynthesis fused ATPase/permease subunit